MKAAALAVEYPAQVVDKGVKNCLPTQMRHAGCCRHTQGRPKPGILSHAHSSVDKRQLVARRNKHAVDIGGNKLLRSSVSK